MTIKRQKSIIKGLLCVVFLGVLMPGPLTQVSNASVSSTFSASTSSSLNSGQGLTENLSLFAPAASVAAQACSPASGCVLKQNGTNARWWADSWRRGRCQSQSDNDWIVTYRTDNQTWRNANPSRIRFYAAGWSKVSWYWWVDRAQANDGVPPGISLCFGGNSFSANDVSGTWVWLTP